MKRIVCRVEGSQEYTPQLAMLVLKNVFRDQGAALRPMYLSDNRFPYQVGQGRLPFGKISVSHQFKSFLQAQKAIEDNIENGINALLITDCYMNWDCPENVLNKPLERLESYLQRHEVSVAIMQDYSEKVPRGKFPQVCRSMDLKEFSLDARDNYDEMYFGEAFVLPYGVLPVFFIERVEDSPSRSRLDIRYMAPFR